MSEEPAPSKRRLRPAQVIVVVVLAGFLVAFLYSALAAAREGARIANCQSNVHAFGLSYAMYSDLYSNRCPDAGVGKSAADHFNLLTNVTAAGKIFYCPSDKYRTPKAEFQPGDALTSANVSYGYVAGANWQVQPDSILMFDRGLTGTTVGSRWSKTSPHGTKGGNQLFLDGHVEFKPTLIQTLKGETVVTDP